MTDSNDKTPEAIKKHKVKYTHEMKGPLGAKIRQNEAEKLLNKGQERFDNSNRAAKYAKMEKEKIADKEHVREGTRGRLSKEHGQATKKKELER